MNEGPTLIIPDVHQDFAFLERCLALGSEKSVTEIILLGDLVDSKYPGARRTEAIRETMEIAQTLIERQDPTTTLLWGNHDWMYWSQRILLKVLHEEKEKELQDQFLSGLEPRTARVLMESEDSPDRKRIQLWENAQLGVARHGWLITHAGVHESLWPKGLDLEDGILALNRRMQDLAEDPGTTDDHPLLGAGPERGGFHDIGGPLWQDFHAEFEDSLPFPQIVGHTRCLEVANKGRSYCIDVCQQVCALLSADGSLEFLNAAG